MTEPASFTLDLTADQQDDVMRKSGIGMKTWTVEHPRLAELAKLAQSRGTDVLRDGPTLAAGPTTASVIDIVLTPDQRRQLRAATGMDFKAVEVAADDLAVEYSEDWTKPVGPLKVGESFLVVTGGEPCDSEESRHVLRIPGDPLKTSGVFGTGRHPTTQIALLLLEEHLPPKCRVLDLGTGSGIMAVAAAQLGAKEITAVDVHPDAVALARKTVQANQLAHRIRVEQGDRPPAGETYDFIVANLFTNVLIALSADLGGALRPGGLVIAGGIVEARVPDVVAAFAAAGLKLRTLRAKEDWVAIVVGK